MSVRLLLAAVGVALSAVLAPAHAADPEPSIEVRLRSVDELIGKVDYLGRLIGQEQVVEQIRETVKLLTAEGKGLEGIDTRKPFGLSITLTADVVNSPIRIMVPVADKDRFLGMLKERLDIQAEKADDGTYQAVVPVLETIRIRFANGYAYFGRTAGDLDPKRLPRPEDYFAQEADSTASVVVRFDRIPDDLKQLVIGQFELSLAEQRQKEAENESAVQKAILDGVADELTGGVKSFLEDSKELALRVRIDEKTDDLSAELTLTAKKNTALARNIATVGAKTSLPVGIVTAAGAEPALLLKSKAALPDSLKKDFEKTVEEALKAALKELPGEPEREVLARVFKTISPTLKAAELDLAVGLYGPDAKNRMTLTAAVAVKNGSEIEKLVKDFSPFLAQAADFEFDIEKIGRFTLHAVTLADAPEEMQKIFGTRKIWLATSEDVLVIGVEPDGKAIRAGLKAKAAPAPTFSLELATARLANGFGQNLKPDELKALMRDTFGKAPSAGRDTITVEISGGEQFTIRAAAKGRAIRLLVGMAQLSEVLP